MTFVDYFCGVQCSWNYLISELRISICYCRMVKEVRPSESKWFTQNIGDYTKDKAKTEH